uniref:Anaphase-promoting complex subunit 4 WD40 domain-containing protein n=1 Tax=Amphimedon queenslandica TaxID=400682 RepID=A0A1X7ST02_AMPQE
MILQWDPRLPAFPTRRLLGHAQEVCGLCWSPNHQHLASGGNDNKAMSPDGQTIVIIAGDETLRFWFWL